MDAQPPHPWPGSQHAGCPVPRPQGTVITALPLPAASSNTNCLRTSEPVWQHPCPGTTSLCTMLSGEWIKKRAGKERESQRFPEELGRMPVRSQKINPKAFPELNHLSMKAGKGWALPDVKNLCRGKASPSREREIRASARD